MPGAGDSSSLPALRPTDTLRIRGFWSYARAELTEDAPGLLPDGAAAFKGDRLAGAPKHRAGLIVSRAMRLSDDIRLDLSYDYGLGRLRPDPDRRARGRREPAGLRRSRPLRLAVERVFLLDGDAVRREPARRIRGGNDDGNAQGHSLRRRLCLAQLRVLRAAAEAGGSAFPLHVLAPNEPCRSATSSSSTSSAARQRPAGRSLALRHPPPRRSRRSARGRQTQPDPPRRRRHAVGARLGAGPARMVAGVTIEGTQLEDEREPLLWGLVNLFHRQMERLEDGYGSVPEFDAVGKPFAHGLDSERHLDIGPLRARARSGRGR